MVVDRRSSTGPVGSSLGRFRSLLACQLSGQSEGFLCKRVSEGGKRIKVHWFIEFTLIFEPERFEGRGSVLGGKML